MADDRQVVVERVIEAPPETIFPLLADPAKHAEIDGSGTVKSASRSEPLTEVGQRFAVSMRMGLPYRSHCTVVELEPNRRIAWKPLIEVGPIPVLGGQRWRYELEPQPGGATLVRETYVWGEARFAPVIGLLGFPTRAKADMERTLERIAALVESS